jgi:ABC-2 type transport system permease protein
MIFLCGLFFPIEKLPWAIRPLSYAFPLTYGVDAMRGAIVGNRMLPLAVNIVVLIAFCVGLFAFSLHNIRKKWIV